MIFKNKFLQQVLDKKNFLQVLTCRLFKVAILNNFHKNLTSHKSLI
jgi:2-C-methyl-D-erythritol 4-phosphate cytidylyltransferase